MANKLTISPALAAAVERARSAAAEAGELLSPGAGPVDAPLSPEVRAAFAEWRASGDYDRAVTEVVADDPDLATR